MMDKSAGFLTPSQKKIYDDAKVKLSKKDLSDEERTAIMLEACTQIKASADIIETIQAAEAQGASAVSSFSQEETFLVYAWMLMLNPETDAATRKKARDYLLGLGYSVSVSAPAKMVCVPYVADSYMYTEFYKTLTNGADSTIIRLTTSLYAALAGGENRDGKNLTGTNLLNEYVKLLVSLGSSGEAAKIKLPGQTEYEPLYDNSTVSFTKEQQLIILYEAGIVNTLDILFFTDNKYKTDVDQYHAGMMDSSATYTSRAYNSETGIETNRVDEPLSGAKDTGGYDFVLMNHSSEALEAAKKLFGR